MLRSAIVILSLFIVHSSHAEVSLRELIGLGVSEAVDQKVSLELGICQELNINDTKDCLTEQVQTELNSMESIDDQRPEESFLNNQYEVAIYNNGTYLGSGPLWNRCYKVFVVIIDVTTQQVVRSGYQFTHACGE